MKAEDVKTNLYKTVQDTKNSQTVTLIGYNRGWLEVEDESTDNVYKLRAKDVEVIEGQPDAIPEDMEDVEEFDENEAKIQSGDEITIKCPDCAHKWETKKTDNFVCPSCKHLFNIKLHPDLDRYVKGLGATESGRDTVDINDFVATELRSLAIEEAFEKTVSILCDGEIEAKYWFSKAVGREWGVFVGEREEEFECKDALMSFLWERYKHLNLGMRRMNLSNLLRGAINRSSKMDAES